MQKVNNHYHNPSTGMGYGPGGRDNGQMGQMENYKKQPYFGELDMNKEIMGGIDAMAMKYIDQNSVLRGGMLELQKINSDAFKQLAEAHQRIRVLEDSCSYRRDATHRAA